METIADEGFQHVCPTVDTHFCSLPSLPSAGRGVVCSHCGFVPPQRPRPLTAKLSAPDTKDESDESSKRMSVEIRAGDFLFSTWAMPMRKGHASALQLGSVFDAPPHVISEEPIVFFFLNERLHALKFGGCFETKLPVVIF